MEVGVEMFHGHSGAVEALEWDREEINGVERELPQKQLVMEDRCREVAGQGIVGGIFWKSKRTVLACCDCVCLV